MSVQVILDGATLRTLVGDERTAAMRDDDGGDDGGDDGEERQLRSAALRVQTALNEAAQRLIECEIRSIGKWSADWSGTLAVSLNDEYVQAIRTAVRQEVTNIQVGAVEDLSGQLKVRMDARLEGLSRIFDRQAQDSFGTAFEQLVERTLERIMLKRLSGSGGTD